jgi:hypothetical protein
MCTQLANDVHVDTRPVHCWYIHAHMLQQQYVSVQSLLAPTSLLIYAFNVHVYTCRYERMKHRCTVMEHLRQERVLKARVKAKSRASLAAAAAALAGTSGESHLPTDTSLNHKKSSSGVRNRAPSIMQVCTDPDVLLGSAEVRVTFQRLMCCTAVAS